MVSFLKMTSRVINCFGMIVYKYWMLWLLGTGEERSEADCWEPVGGEMSGFVPLNCPPIVTSVPFSVLGFVSETTTTVLLSDEVDSVLYALRHWDSMEASEKSENFVLNLQSVCCVQKEAKYNENCNIYLCCRLIIICPVSISDHQMRNTDNKDTPQQYVCQWFIKLTATGAVAHYLISNMMMMMMILCSARPNLPQLPPSAARVIISW